jgi:hypothetical protein
MKAKLFFDANGRRARSLGLQLRVAKLAHLSEFAREAYKRGWWAQHTTVELARKAEKTNEAST